MRWFKNIYFKTGLIFGLFLISILVVLPRTPINLSNRYFSYETSIGGYYLDFFNGGWVLDLTDFKKGLDLAGGVRIVLRADMSEVAASDRDSALESAREVIERRVNFLGVSEPNIVPVKTQDEYRIVVEIPGVEDINTALNLVGRTAQINFRQLKPEVPWDGTQFQDYYYNPEVWENTGVTGRDLRGSNVVFANGGVGSADLNGTAPRIQMLFSTEGRDKFSTAAKANINKPLGIFLDDDPIPLSMPVVSDEFADGVFQDPVITGNFSIEEANNLTLQIRAGALPVSVEVLQQEKVGASLGDAAISASFRAGLIGFIIILVFMVLLYGRAGLIADMALILYALLVLSVFKVIPVVLTLPGIAGFLLSIGMAVDANILIFERVREELKAGKPRSIATKLGFENAWSSIRDSNLSSLITAVILFYMGSGPVKGFALTLFVGITISLFTAVFVVRNLLTFFKLDKDPETKLRKFIRKVFKRNKNELIKEK